MIIQAGRPKMVRGLRFFFSSGLGRGVWQRQQTLLSSGFQVPQLGQSMRWSGSRLVDRSISRSVDQLVGRAVGWSCGRATIFRFPGLPVTQPPFHRFRHIAHFG